MSRSTGRHLAINVDGEETTVISCGGCHQNSAVVLWTIRGGSYVQAFPMKFIPAVLDSLLAQSL